MIFFSFLSPTFLKAASIFAPFGGKVKSYNPNACPEVTTTIAAITAGTVQVVIGGLQIEEVNSNQISSNPLSGEKQLGTLTINGLQVMPFYTNIYMYYTYQSPNAWVLGNSVGCESICNLINDIPVVGSIFGELICDTLCETVSKKCPLDLIFKIGSSLPKTSDTKSHPQQK